MKIPQVELPSFISSHYTPRMPPPTPSTLRVQFIHDWLTGLRGGEKVLLQLVRLFPNSQIATLLHAPNSTHPDIDSRVTQTSFLQKIPNIATTYRNYLPLFPTAIRSLQFDPNCDLIISVSHAVAKGITPPSKKIPHLCYCNTPMRYIWGMQDQYLPRFSPKRLALAAVIPSLRSFDKQNDHITQFIANSHTVAARIKKIYRRHPVVIHPGIDETLYTLPTTPPTRTHYLIVSALVPYKRIDLAIKAFLPPYSPRLAGDNASQPRKLLIVGKGPEESNLKALAKNAPHIQFLGHLPDDTLLQHYQSARALLFPGEEDFGLTPLESQASGTPVIAYNQGGATETILPNTTGLLFNDHTPHSLQQSLTHFESLPNDTFNPTTLRQHALHFTWSHFQKKITTLVSNTLKQK